MIVRLLEAGRQVDLPAQVMAGLRSPFKGDVASSRGIPDRKRSGDRARASAFVSKGGA